MNIKDLKPSDYTVTPPVSTPLNINNLKPSDYSVQSTPPDQGFLDTFKNRFDDLTKISKTTADSYAQQKGESTGAWSPMVPITNVTDVTTSPLRATANIIPSGIGLAKNLLSMANPFNWGGIVNNAVNDPVGFAEGMFGDAIVKPVAGVASAVRDVATGEGGKAVGDIGTGIQEGYTALVDDPVTSLIQMKFAHDFVKEPAKTTKGLAEPIKTVAHPIETAKTISAAARNGASSFVEGLGNIKKAWSGAGEGYQTLLEGYKKQVVNMWSNSLKSDTLQKDLQSLDKNSADYELHKSQLEKAQADIEIGQEKITQVANMTAGMFSKMFEQSSDTPENIVKGVIDPFNKIKQFGSNLYKENLTNSKGGEINLSHGDMVGVLQPFVDKINYPDTKELHTKFDAVLDDYKLASWAEEIKNTTGKTPREYVESLEKGIIDLKTKRLPYDNSPETAELYKQKEEQMSKMQDELETVKHFVKKIKPMHEKPLTANRAKGEIVSNLRGKIPEKTTGNIFTSFDEMVKKGAEDMLMKGLEKENKSAAVSIRLADNLWKKMKESDLGKAIEKLQTKSEISEKDIIKLLVDHPAEMKKYISPSAFLDKIKNLTAKNILDEAKNDEGMYDPKKINKGIEQYSRVIGPKVSQALREVRDFFDPVKNSYPQNVTDAMKAKIDELSGEKGKLAEAEKKVPAEETKMKTAAENMKTVGTTPEEISKNIGKISTPEDLAKMTELTGKTPVELGTMRMQTLAQDLNIEFGANLEKVDIGKIRGLIDSLTKDIKGKDPEVIKQMYDKESQKLVKDITRAADKFEILEREGERTFAVRAFKGMLGVLMMNWHMHLWGMKNLSEAIIPKKYNLEEAKTRFGQEDLSAPKVKPPKKDGAIKKSARIGATIGSGIKTTSNQE